MNNAAHHECGRRTVKRKYSRLRENKQSNPFPKGQGALPIVEFIADHEDNVLRLPANRKGSKEESSLRLRWLERSLLPYDLLRTLSSITILPPR